MRAGLTKVPNLWGNICRVENAMDAAQELSHQEKESLAGNVMDSLGEPQESESEVLEGSHDQEGEESDSTSSKKREPGWQRLKRKNREHEMEIRDLRSRIEHMQSSQPQHEQPMSPHQPFQSGDMAEHIHKAVSQVLQHKEMEEHKAKEAERMAHVHKQYQGLQKHLDNVSDRYDDFDDVVRGEDAPFTPHMRDAALLLPHSGKGSAGEVLYKLGKNRPELERIAQLHPLDQARELNKLSHALVSGDESKNAQTTRQMGNIKSNPVVNSHGITDKTPASEIRARMKAGKFK